MKTPFFLLEYRISPNVDPPPPFSFRYLVLFKEGKTEKDRMVLGVSK